MSPRPTPDQIQALHDRVKSAAADRDQRKAEAVDQIEREFWTAIAAEIEGGYFGIQRDIAEALGVTRETVRRQANKYAPGT